MYDKIWKIYLLAKYIFHILFVAKTGYVLYFTINFVR